jgi:hypothetical protein
MRNFLYLSTGERPLSEDEHHYYQGHLDHCIEVLRISAMCAADLSLYTFTWPKQEKFKFLDGHAKAPRKCVNWNQLEQWSLRRKISLTPTVIFPGKEEEQPRSLFENHS